MQSRIAILLPLLVACGLKSPVPCCVLSEERAQLAPARDELREKYGIRLE